MLQAGRVADLPLEPLRAQRRRQLGVQDLEGDRPIVPQVAGEVDRGHAAASELALERVSILQVFTKLIQGVDPGSPAGGTPKIRLGPPQGKVGPMAVTHLRGYI